MIQAVAQQHFQMSQEKTQTLETGKLWITL